MNKIFFPVFKGRFHFSTFNFIFKNPNFLFYAVTNRTNKQNKQTTKQTKIFIYILIVSLFLHLTIILLNLNDIKKIRGNAIKVL